MAESADMTRRIRVAQIVATLDWSGPGGGVSRFATELCLGLDAQAFEVQLYALWRLNKPVEGATQARLRERGVTAHLAADFDSRHPYQGFRRSLCALRPLIALQRPDILHSQQEFGDLAALVLGRQLRLPTVTRTVHSLEWHRRPWRRLLFTQLLYPVAFTAEAGVSQAIVDRLNRRPLARALGRKASRLYNAVNLARFGDVSVDKAEARKRLGLPLDMFVAGSVGRLSVEKGYGYLLEALAEVLRQVPNACVLLVGGGDQEAALRAQATRLGIAEHVIFAGERADVEALLPALDVFVSSSLREGLPTAVMEAMAAGVPVIGTDVAGTCEVVKDRISGRLVPARQPAALAAAIQELRAQPALALRLADRARATVQEFSIDAVSEEYSQFYRRLLGELSGG